MRVLLLSANTGEGHNSTSRAIILALEAQGVECQQWDALAFLSPKFSKFISNWHSRIYRHVPKLFDAGYGMMERSTPAEDFTLLYELLSLGAKKLYSMLLEGNFDAVVCVHVFAGQMMTEVRRVWNYTAPCFLVTTDYTCHPTTEQCEMDGYFIPDAELAEEFQRAGILTSKLIPTGIPVRQEFYSCQSQSAARSRLGLPVQGCVVLLMCGSMGAGPIRQVAQELCRQMPRDCTVVAICGNHERLQESLLELQAPGLKVLGFTKEVSDYMDAADLIITKPGGLSSTEAANKHLPMVLIDSVGGCERRNFEFFLSREMAVGGVQAEHVTSLALTLINDPTLCQQLRENLAQRFRQNSARVLAKHVMAEADNYRSRLGKDRKGMESADPVYLSFGRDGTEPKLTFQNLARSFAGEAQARTRYSIYAKVARQEDLGWIAQVFEQTAQNEAAHAEEFLAMMQKLDACSPEMPITGNFPFQLGNTSENLAAAAKGELHEHDTAYPEYAQIARREGFDDAARLWMQIARVEGVHHNAFRQLADQLMDSTLTEKESPVRWRCVNCGYTYESTHASDPCPVCRRGAGWQAGQLDERRMLIRKK